MAGLYTAPRQTPLLPEEHNTRHGTASRETPVTGLKSLEYGNEFMGKVGLNMHIIYISVAALQAGLISSFAAFGP